MNVPTYFHNYQNTLCKPCTRRWFSIVSSAWWFNVKALFLHVMNTSSVHLKVPTDSDWNNLVVSSDLVVCFWTWRNASLCVCVCVHAHKTPSEYFHSRDSLVKVWLKVNEDRAASSLEVWESLQQANVTLQPGDNPCNHKQMLEGHKPHSKHTHTYTHSHKHAHKHTIQKHTLQTPHSLVDV